MSLLITQLDLKALCMQVLPLLYCAAKWSSEIETERDFPGKEVHQFKTQVESDADGRKEERYIFCVTYLILR